MEQWFAFKAWNSQTAYGWGTAREAEAYADHLNRGREINLYGAYEMTGEEAVEEGLGDDRTDAVNLDDELRAIADEGGEA